MSGQQQELNDYLKQAGMAQALEPVLEWKQQADAAIRQLAATGELFTSEDVTARVGQPTDADGRARPNAVGAIINANARKGIIERIGFVKATRANQHSALISQWRGK
jgi:hypothetical protein